MPRTNFRNPVPRCALQASPHWPTPPAALGIASASRKATQGALPAGARLRLVVGSAAARWRPATPCFAAPLDPCCHPLCGNRYLPPELLKDDLSALTKADIFSLGASIYALALGHELPSRGPRRCLRAPHRCPLVIIAPARRPSRHWPSSTHASIHASLRALSWRISTLLRWRSGSPQVRSGQRSAPATTYRSCPLSASPRRSRRSSSRTAATRSRRAPPPQSRPALRITPVSLLLPWLSPAAEPDRGPGIWPAAFRGRAAARPIAAKPEREKAARADGGGGPS